MSTHVTVLFIFLSLYLKVSYSESHLTPNQNDIHQSPMSVYEADDTEGDLIEENSGEDLNHGFNITGEGNETDVDPIPLSEYNNMLQKTWLNLTSVMDLFTQREYDNISSIQALTAAYRYTHRQQKKLRTLPTGLKKPFIVIEGLDKQKKIMLAKRLALHLQGHVVPNPPNTFDVVLKHMPNSSLLTNGFFVLSTYIAGLHVRYATQSSTAIVPGYWLGRAAVSIARNFVRRPPPFESKFWVWPKDLVKPDVVFYLTDRFSLHQFDDHKIVQRYLHVFDNWIDPKCIPLVNTQSIETLMEEIEPYLERL